MKKQVTKIDAHRALQAANAIMRFGRPNTLGTHWRGITLVTDHDGYTVTLMDEDVELRLLFHNKFELKAKNRVAHLSFIEKLEQLVKESQRKKG